MAAFVIVHGGWAGGWIWQRVARQLRAAGHEVYTPTLTGMGERIHLATPEVDLATHVLDVVNVLEAEDLHEVVLAGHSYGGMPVTGVAERVPERLSQIVYLDAFVPRDGESLLDLLGPQARADTERAFQNSDDGWRVLWPGDTAPPRPWPAPTPRFVPQPWKTFSQPLAVGNPAAAALPRTYVRCTADKAPGEGSGDAFAKSWARAQEGGWRLRELDTGHNGVTTEAGGALLLELFPVARALPSRGCA